MTATGLLILCSVCAAPPNETPSPIYRPSPAFAAAIRGQSPYDDAGLPPGNFNPAQGTTYQAPLGGAPLGGAPLSSPPANQAFGSDPFLSGGPVLPVPQYDQGLTYGITGPQPYRFGWTTRLDGGYLSASNTDNNAGKFEVWESNLALRYTTPLSPNFILAWTPEVNYRSWQGPSTPDLPGGVYRFASDYELSTPANNPVAMQLGFTSSFASDLRGSTSSDAWQYDARGALFFRLDPTFTVALGAMYLDRVHDQILPYAGVIWAPSNEFEARIMFPKTRISYLLGGAGGYTTWLYGSLEYNIEAYQIDLRGPGGADEQIQIEDYRAMLGLRTDNGMVTGFVEAGYVFARHADFHYGTPDFNIDGGFITRFGLRF